MSYGNPKPITYALGLQAPASAVVALRVKPPIRTNRGLVVDIAAAVTVLFTAVTTPAFIRVGTVALPLRYASLNMGTAAINTSLTSRDVLGTIILDIDMARDSVTEIQLSTVAPTGGSPAGSAYMWITIAWS